MEEEEEMVTRSKGGAVKSKGFSNFGYSKEVSMGSRMKQSDALTVNLQRAQKATAKTMIVAPPKPPPKQFAKADDGSDDDNE